MMCVGAERCHRGKEREDVAMGEAVAKEGVLDVRADIGGYAGGMGIHK